MSTLQVNGTGFLTSDRLFARFADADAGPVSTTRQVFNPLGPNAGNNDPDWSILQWTDTLIEADIVDATIDSKFLAEVEVEDVAQTYGVVFDVNPDIAVPVALTYPVLTGICSPALETIRFEGTNFLNATAGVVGYAIPRGTAPILGGPQAVYEFADGSPDANGWSLITHTDTVIELHNAALGAGDTVYGVAFHDPTETTMYYHEPWGDPSPYSALVDGAGC